MANKIAGGFFVLAGLVLLVFLIPFDSIFGDGTTSEPSVSQYIASETESIPEQGELVGPFDVVRVVDGDTIIVDYYGEEERVRLIGVDTPESVHPNDARNTEEGETASDYTKALLEGKRVMLEFDEEMYDRYERMLAYVYLDGEMVNAKLLTDGYADTMTIPPNTKYAEWFDSLADTAA